MIRSVAVQAAWIALAFALCPLAALVTTRDPSVPVARTHTLVDFERSLGLFFEADLHAWLQRHDWLLAAAGGFYVWAHVPALVAVLVYSGFVGPARFARLRDWFLSTQLIVVAGYLLLPTAPPRLVPGLGFEDTLTQLWGAEGAALAHTVQSPYAAMPSGHVAFAVIVAAGLWSFSRRPAIRTLAVAYPLLVTVLVMATANHLWVDAVAGVLVAIGGLGVARAWRGASAVRGWQGRQGVRPALVPIDYRGERPRLPVRRAGPLWRATVGMPRGSARQTGRPRTTGQRCQ